MIQNLFAATTLATLFTISGAGILQAAETSTLLQPLEAMSVSAGHAKTVGYYVVENARCKLVVTTAREPDWSREAFAVVRFEAAIPAGGSTRRIVGDGQELEFRCRAGARSLVVENADRALASAASR